MTHWAHINIFPDEIIALNRELIHHPRLQELLAKHRAEDWEIKMAEIALYCEVIVDGDYLPEQMVKLAEILEIKLRQRREDNRSVLVII
jgi:hypothetical protein